jgi:hypothetical protein
MMASIFASVVQSSGADRPTQSTARDEAHHGCHRKSAMGRPQQAKLGDPFPVRLRSRRGRDGMERQIRGESPRTIERALSQTTGPMKRQAMLERLVETPPVSETVPESATLR